MLEIKDLTVKVEDKEIIKKLDLNLEKGKVYAIMGPNGSGKSTLANVLAGSEAYDIVSGNIKFNNQDITEEDACERALLGIFLAFQYPVEIAGVPTITFLKEAINAHFARQGKKPMDAMQAVTYLKEKAKKLNISDEMLKRYLNFGFSGGEKKRLEIFQMAVLQPKLVILDETDSGLDIDALQHVSKVVNSLRAKNRTFLIITHYQRLLELIVPDQIFVMTEGKIVEKGGAEIGRRLEKEGYKLAV